MEHDNLKKDFKKLTDSFFENKDYKNAIEIIPKKFG